MATHKIQTTVRIDNDILCKLQFIAKINKRSLNSLIEILLEEHIKQYEAKNGTIIR